MILPFAQTGLRVSELTSLAIRDIDLGTGHTSARSSTQQRITPLTATTVALLRGWLAERADAPADPLLPTTRGTPLTRAEHGHTRSPDPARAQPDKVNGDAFPAPPITTWGSSLSRAPGLVG